jgi:hypothetical protein
MTEDEFHRNEVWIISAAVIAVVTVALAFGFGFVR